MVPNAVSTCNDALSAEYCAVFLAGQLGQGILKLFPGELLRSLNAEVGEYLVGVVTVVMVVMSAAALAVVVVMFVLVLVVVVVAAFVVMMVLMLVIIMS